MSFSMVSRRNFQITSSYTSCLPLFDANIDPNTRTVFLANTQAQIYKCEGRNSKHIDLTKPADGFKSRIPKVLQSIILIWYLPIFLLHKFLSMIANMRPKITSQSFRTFFTNSRNRDLLMSRQLNKKHERFDAIKARTASSNDSIVDQTMAWLVSIDCESVSLNRSANISSRKNHRIEHNQVTNAILLDKTRQTSDYR